MISTKTSPHIKFQNTLIQNIPKISKVNMRCSFQSFHQKTSSQEKIQRDHSKVKPHQFHSCNINTIHHVHHDYYSRER